MNITDKIEKYLSEAKDYKAFFAAKLKEYGVSGVAEMDDKTKKKFFDEIEKEWTGEKE
jgi:hypothetical protein